ncbi:MAG: hypothetical protein ACJ76S_11925 [Solirubrobacteraceae bacterium]|jgi:hypothetical protein
MASRRHGAGIVATLVATVSVTAAVPQVAAAVAPAHWRPFARLPWTIDLTRPRLDGRLTLSTGGRLGVLRPGRALVPFARGPAGYRTAVPGAGGNEPYITLTSARRVPGAGCGFLRDEVIALEPKGHVGVVRVGPTRRARWLADLPADQLPNSIAFDTAGTFGHRVLVTAALADRTKANLYAIDCRGRVATLTAGMPVVEGGANIAPRSFGRFGGQLIVPDERSGEIRSINARGQVQVVARSGLPIGPDTGVDAAGFVPLGFSDRWAALMADRDGQPGVHPGTNTLLGISGRALRLAGVRAGDLLVANEGGGATIAVRCGRLGCSVRRVASGPAISHPEGHIVVTAR